MTLLAGMLTIKLVKNSSDFINAGRRLPMFLNASALFALWFGSETIIGASSEFIQHGLLGVIEDPFGAALCLLLFAMFFARKLYRMNLLTINDLFRKRFGARVELWSSIIMIMTFVGWIGAQFVALGILMHTIADIPVHYGIIISSVIVTLYTMTGGMWAISVTDFIQSVMIVVGLIWTAIVVTGKAGGVVEIFNSAPEGYFRFIPDPDPSAIVHYLVAWSILGLGSLPSQDIFQRVNSARNEKAAVRSTYIASVVYIILAMLPLYITLSANVLQPDNQYEDTQIVLPSIVSGHTSLWVQTVFFGALISAILSTCSGSLLAPASVFSENIVRPLLGHRIREKTFLLILRLSVVFFALLALLMSLSRRNIYELVAESSILGMVTLLVPMIIALYGRRYYASGAMFSMFSGLIVWFVTSYIFDRGMEAVPLGLAASILGMIFGIYRTRWILRRRYQRMQKNDTL